MAACELCGKDTFLLNVHVEKVPMHVCQKCSTYGTVLKETTKKIIKPEREEIIEDIIDTYALTIKQKREHLNISQQELATKIGEKESTLAKIEQGHLPPSFETARKLEKTLTIQLITRIVNEPTVTKQLSPTLTLGDLIKKK